MSKVFYLSLVGASLLLGTATMAVADSSNNMEATIQKLQAQVEALSARLNNLDAKQETSNAASARPAHHKNHIPCAHKHNKEKIIQEVTNRTEVYVNQKLDEKEKQTPKGYIHVAGSNTAIKIGGYVKLDAIYDAGPSTGDLTNLPDLPLRFYTPDVQRTGFFHAHARESRISIATLTATKEMGDLALFVDGDFYGTNNFGTAEVSRSEPAAASAYNFRLRRAYIDFVGFRIGQDWSTMYDLDALGTSVEFNGPTGNSDIRNVQIRYTLKDCTNNLSWAFALENPYTDYTDNTGTRKGTNSFLSGSGGDGFQQLPDAITMIKMRGDSGHIAFRALARQLVVKSLTASGSVFRKSQAGWAVGLSGKLKTTYKGGIYAQAIIGDGVGRYIFDLAGQSAAFDPTTRKFSTQRAWGVSVGIEHYWNEQWRSNLAYGHSGLSLSKFAPRNVTATTAPISRSFDQITVNTLFNPIKDFEIGLEYDYYLRRATGGYKGRGQRFQLGIKYSF
jgi:hypothetical protein